MIQMNTHTHTHTLTYTNKYTHTSTQTHTHTHNETHTDAYVEYIPIINISSLDRLYHIRCSPNQQTNAHTHTHTHTLAASLSALSIIYTFSAVCSSLSSTKWYSQTSCDKYQWA
eukprot:GHVQ01019971.1.p3 GENE.GHVQ01019971.1~~GHVQ01019971.1.p3  ORF type:complete len:114 (-),score=31.84 GHVQ01019971.1:85-426(-)